MCKTKASIILILLLSFFQVSGQEPFVWTCTRESIFRDGIPFFMKGQSWSKKTDFTYKKGSTAEAQVKQVLSELHEIGINVIRLYGSPDESDWEGSSNYGNLIQWIEEWNVDNPDEGDPNKAMYYMVQISPEDPQSPLSGDLPQNTEESFNRAINDLGNPGSVGSMIQLVNQVSKGSRFLLAYLIYHELNASSKYQSWYSAIGAGGIENFMNAVADSIHNNFAPGKLISHTGDAKDQVPDIYESIEALDGNKGNVFAGFDMLGFNLYISTNSLLKENSYYNRIVKRRSLSVDSLRGWFIGETGASYDKEADPGSVSAANYTNPQGGANLQIMWQKTKDLGDLNGFMLFTVQDNDKQETVNLNAMKQRGFFDYYGDKKFLYYIYPDIIDEISTNYRHHSTYTHALKVSIIDDLNSYTCTFNFQNKSGSTKDFLWTIHGDNGGSSSQRFSIELGKEYVSLEPWSEKEIVEIVAKPAGNLLLAISASTIKELSPSNQYLWGREHLLDDAISTVAGLNLNLENLPDENTGISSNPDEKSKDIVRGLIIQGQNQIITVPDGTWELTLFNINGSVLYRSTQFSFEHLDPDKLLPEMHGNMAVYVLKRL